MVDPGQKDGVSLPSPATEWARSACSSPARVSPGEQRGAGGQRPQARGPAAVDRGGVLGLAGQQLHGAGHGAPPHPDQAAQVLDVGVHQGVVGALEGLAEQVAGPGEAPAELGGVGRPQEPEGAGLAHRGEPGGAVERARGRGVAAAREGVAGRLLERPGDLLVRLESRGGEVPGPAVGGRRRVERLGERPVGGAPLGRGGAVVDGRAHQRVAELEPAGLDARQALRARPRAGRRARAPSAAAAARIVFRSPESSAAAASSARRASVLRASARPRKRRSTAAVAGSGSGIGSSPASWASDRSAGTSASASGLPAVSSTSRSTTDVAMGRANVWSSSVRAAAASIPSRVSCGRPVASTRAGSPSRVGQQDGHALVAEPAGGVQQGLGGLGVEPLQVVHQHQHPAVLGGRGQQAQRGGRDREPGGGNRRAQRQRPGERVGLGARDPVEPAEHRPEQVGQPRERDLGLGLDPPGPQHQEVAGALLREAQERALADAGVAAHQERPAASRCRMGKQDVDAGAGVLSAEQHPELIVEPGKVEIVEKGVHVDERRKRLPRYTSAADPTGSTRSSPAATRASTAARAARRRRPGRHAR